MTFLSSDGATSGRRVAAWIPALVTGLLLATFTLQTPAVAQSSVTSVESARARGTARMSVAPVLTVVPRDEVVVRFGTGAAGAEWVAAERSVRVECAANVPHTLRVRAAREGATPRGRVEWSRAEEEAWHPLDADPRPVRSDLSPGRRESCAVLRLRWRPEASGGPAGAPAEVALDFSLEPAER